MEEEYEEEEESDREREEYRNKNKEEMRTDRDKETEQEDNEKKENKKEYMMEGVPIPDDLVRFIVIEKYIPYVNFYNIFKSSVEMDDELRLQDNVMESSLLENNRLLVSIRNKMNKKYDGIRMKEKEDKEKKENKDEEKERKEEKQKEKNISDQKRMKLNRLSKISYSHGISWDSLDNLYFEFFKGKTEAYNSWEYNKLKLIEFANKVALKKINDTKTLNEFKKSGRLIKLFTQKYYNRWYDCYMAPFSTGMLIKYLKAHVTMAVLNRESQELTGETLDFKFRQSDENPYFKECL